MRRKIFTILLIISLILAQVRPVLSEEVSPPLSPEAPLAPESPLIEPLVASPTPTVTLLTEAPIAESSPTPKLTPTATVTPTPESSEPVETDLEGQVLEGEVGETTIVTEDATSSVGLETVGNTNLMVEEESIVIVEEESISQANQAQVENTLEQTTLTGENAVSFNVGEAEIVTGDANTSATVVTALNSNLDGLTIEELNIDDHTGDIILNFGENGEAATGSADQFVDELSFQSNQASVENNLTLVSDTGNNQTNYNQGDSFIQTGDANVVANVLNFLNNNFAGELVLGVVNIFGELVGDIILPAEVVSPEFSSIEETSQEEVFQANEAEIENYLNLDANTGGNQTSRNTGGDSSIETGEAEVQVQMLNIANNNLLGGPWWLVIVNVAGEWVGKILGAPPLNATTTQESQVEKQSQQTNQAKIVNNLNLTANTGKNSASNNTGGDSKIKTGDAKILVNLINFVNNNIHANSKLVVTVVNVFGRWLGDFVPPGADQDEPGEDDDNADNDDNDGQEPGDDNDSDQGGNSPDNPSNPSEDEDDTDWEEDEEEDYWSEDKWLLTEADEEFDNPASGAGVLAAPLAGLGVENGSRPLKINFAWLALVLPLTLLSVFLKRRLL